MKTMAIALLILGLTLGCGGGKTVTRLDTASVTDLSGKWNDTDSRLVAEDRAWLQSFAVAKSTKPVVTVGTIRNETSEHIAMGTFIADFERELINSAQIRFVAAKEQRSEVREERWEQQEFASKETAKRLREELGADFILQGAIKTITDQEGKEKVWIGSKKIKKGITQGDWKR
jgi:hypothetical protein